MLHFIFSISEAPKNNVNNVTVLYGVVGGLSMCIPALCPTVTLWY